MARLVACLLLVAQCAGQTQVDVSAVRRSLEARLADDDDDCLLVLIQ